MFLLSENISAEGKIILLGSDGEYLTSTNLTKNKIPYYDQAMSCHSFKNGNGLHGTNMNNMQLYFLTHFIIESFRQEI